MVIIYRKKKQCVGELLLEEKNSVWKSIALYNAILARFICRISERFQLERS